ncbi:MAG: heme lyase CcmF/NrfE family subunit [Pseudomonadales bacterium]|nr:heme lyase CcmF/NrfE family subunit [Pseudomonadales bacterium]
MIAELGHFCLILALGLAACLAIIPALGVRLGNESWMRLSASLPIGLFLFVGMSFACLASAFLTDDFSVAYVARNSNTLLPVYYKFSALWGAHEGSFLLWSLIMAGWTLAVSLFSGALTLDMRARVLSVMGVLSFGFILFLLATSDPFERSLPIYPSEGRDLNPLLQDFGLIVHPPMLYMGYVGLSVPFSFAIATLLSGRLDSAWARWSRPWTNVAWSFLTIGITLGSWWAYYELGWGGWWFWDAVENASFMPWLIGTALIHSLAATEKRGVFKSWTVLLAIFAFSFSMLGAFLVRSGVLTSVHAFAVDPERGLFILAFLTIVVGSSLTLYAVKAAGIKSVAGFDFSSREMFLLANNVLLVVATATVLLGTLSPLAYEALTDGRKISVGPPYFNAVFVPIALLLFAWMALSPATTWRRTPWARLWKRQVPILIGSAIVATALVWLLASFEFVAIFVVTICLWIVAGLLLDVARALGNKRDRIAAFFRMPLSMYGMWLAHLGIAVSVLGIVTTIYFSEEKDVRLEEGMVVEMAGYAFAFEGVTQGRGPNYLSDVGKVRVTRDGKDVVTLFPEKRRYMSGGSVMTEAAIDPSPFRDLYVALGESVDNGAWAVRVHYKPLVRWIWWGGILVAFGGFLTVADKRYRAIRVKRAMAVGAPA